MPARTVQVAGSGAPMVEGSAWHHRVDSGGDVLEVDGLTISTVGSGAREIVSDVDLHLRAAEILALVGESGSGKTTVALAVLGHLREGLELTGGRITLYSSTSTEPSCMTELGEDALRGLRGSRVAYIPQDPAQSLNPSMRVGEQIREVLDVHHYGSGPDERTERVREVLREVGLPDDDAYQRRWPHQLSGGQQQRIGIAMAFAMHPDVLVLDEPTTGLDVTTQALVLDTVRELTVSHKVAGLYITHDLAVVKEIADRVAVMREGVIVESGTTQEVLQRPRHVYSRTLVAAVPDLAGKNQIWEFEARRQAGEFDEDAVVPSRVAGPDGTEPPAERPEPTTERPDASAERPHSTAERAHSTAERADPTSLTSPAADEPIVSVRDLEMSYGSNKVLTSVDLDLRPGECTLLLGESGSGKTTLSRSIAGLVDDWTGSITFLGEELAPGTRDRTDAQRSGIQYVFQSPFSSLNPRRTLGQSLGVPLEMTGLVDATERRARVSDALDAVRLGREFYDRRPGDLSGGERQRAAIARALVNAPHVLVCDEITSALDVSVQASIIDLLVRLREERGMSMLFVTHNIALARHVAARVAVLERGVIVDEGPTDEVLTSPSHAYTRELIANVPTL